MKEIILATANPGKITELQAILSPIQCISQANLGIESPAETGLSFIENALIKARHASHLSGAAALADDSGLVVPSLQGKPGIYSARFAGPDATDAENMDLLLEKLIDITSAADRHAYYYCAIVLLQYPEDPMPIVATGTLAGTIAKHPLGTQGFGYDPIFYLDAYQCTVAQLPASIKNRISHRAQAIKHLRTQL